MKLYLFFFFAKKSLALAGNAPVLPVSKGVTPFEITGISVFTFKYTFVVTQGKSYGRKRIVFYLADSVLLVRIRFF